MTLSHDDANARLLELVYGEAPPAERGALEAHVATCAQCSADLAALGDTRARLRTALEDAPVPSRVHARVLAAATQAAAPLAAAASPVAVAARSMAVAPPAGVPMRGPSLWQRLRRGWTLPTFATVGAVAIVVIGSKVFLEPQKTMERGREAVTAAPAEAEKSAAPAVQPEPAAPAAAEGMPVPPRHFGPGGGRFEALQRAHGGSRPGLLGGGTLAQRLARARGTGASGSTAGLDEPGSGRGVAAAPAAPLPPKPAHDDLLEGALARKPASATESRAKREEAKAEVSNEAASVRRDEHASPPSGWKGGGAANAPAPASAPAVAAPRPAPVMRSVKKKNVADEPLADLGYAGGVPAPSEAADSRVEEQAAAGKLAKQKSAPARPVVAAKTLAAKDADGAGADQENRDKQDEAPSQETLARRADQLFAAHHWSAAIAAYRELLRRYPDADLKPRWRARLTQAQVAEDASAPTSKTTAKRAAKETSKSKATLEAVPAAE
jgi:anti-sigma factor RsiW